MAPPAMLVIKADSQGMQAPSLDSKPIPVLTEKGIASRAFGFRSLRSPFQGTFFSVPSSSFSIRSLPFSSFSAFTSSFLFFRHPPLRFSLLSSTLFQLVAWYTRRKSFRVCGFPQSRRPSPWRFLNSEVAADFLFRKISLFKGSLP